MLCPDFLKAKTRAVGTTYVRCAIKNKRETVNKMKIVQDRATFIF